MTRRVRAEQPPARQRARIAAAVLAMTGIGALAWPGAAQAAPGAAASGFDFNNDG
ncbi:hypothetical protein G3M53_73180, partial [Streptomyces sp. SID7982]|nr:hypothetical protein [Streptomyces sp. SID7982]